MPIEKICFFIAPIGEEGSEDRERSDQVRDFVIKPALEKFKYHVIRADEISKSGIITSQVIQHIFDAHLVIAYLATDNPNVFYELALRHVIRKPFIQIIEEGQKIPFDVSGLRTISFKYGDLRSAENCKIEIQKQVEGLERNPEDVESPVTQAIDVKSLRDSHKPVEQGMATIIEMLERIAGEIATLKSEPVQSTTTFSLANPLFSSGAENPFAGLPGFKSVMASMAAEGAKTPKTQEVARPFNPTKKGG